MGGPEEIVYLASFHETLVRGEDMTNAVLFSAAKEMFEAIHMGLTGTDLNGEIVSQQITMEKLSASYAKAQGLEVEPENAEPETKV